MYVPQMVDVTAGNGIPLLSIYRRLLWCLLMRVIINKLINVSSISQRATLKFIIVWADTAEGFCIQFYNQETGLLLIFFYVS
jgi:hypothetical protein